MATINSYRDLKVWQQGIAISLGVYELTKTFPEGERFGLVSQMRRCSISIPSNIAEGHARDSTKEFLRFIAIAKGSLAELETQITIANQLGFVAPEGHDELMAQCDKQSRMLSSLRSSLSRK